MLSANDVADFFLSPIDSEIDGEQITNLKLQKLLYYAQGLSLAILDRPIFQEKIFHWEHGPVVNVIYHQYKRHQKSPLPAAYIEADKYQDNELYILNRVRRDYGQYSAWKLRTMTHQEQPWLKTCQGAEITIETMSEFFKKTIPVTSFNFDLKRMRERVETTPIAIPHAIQNFEDFQRWIQTV